MTHPRVLDRFQTTTHVRDYEYFIPTKFHQNASSSSGEVENESFRTMKDNGRTDGAL